MMKTRPPWFRKPPWKLVAGVLLLFSADSRAQLTASLPQAPASNHVHLQDGIYLVFPFENAGASPRLDWIGEGLEELTIQRLSNSGQQVYSHSGRLTQMDAYGMPATAKLSRATMLHIAQEMDADYVVFGSFTSDGKMLSIQARVMRVSLPRLQAVVKESGALETLMDLHTKLVWRLLSGNDRNYHLSLTEFAKLQRQVRLDAFEQYIRGLLANDDDVRLRDLKEAARLEPDWPDPAYALGQVYFTRNDCNAALPWFARVPVNHERSVEAIFASGVCRLKMGQPEKAEEVFHSLQEGLQHNLVSGADLPEILNNLGLARAHQGNTAGALTALGRARDIDPDEDDYPFNLGLLALKQNEYTTATTHFQEATRREPDNPEDVAFLIYALEKSGKKPEAEAERKLASETFGEKGLPALKIDAKGEALGRFERVKRELDTTAVLLDLGDPQVTHSAAAGTAPAKDTPTEHVRRGRQELNAGRLDAAEKEFRAAVALEPKNAAAHQELGESARRRGKLDEAVKELQISLAVRDSAVVRTKLARVYLEQKKTDQAREEVQKAVKLAPNYAEAKQLLEHLEKSKPTGGAQ